MSFRGSFRHKIRQILLSRGLAHLYGTGLYSAAQRTLGEIEIEHFKKAHPCPRFPTREEMHSHINASFLGNTAIEFLEFGVFRGDSMRLWSSINLDPESRFYGFDSFEGLPEAWRAGRGRGHFNTDGVIPELKDSRVSFVKGWFHETIPPFASTFCPLNRLVIHFDADLYSSTLVPLIYLKPFFLPGTLLLFDEFYDQLHEFKAFMDFQKIANQQFRVLCAVGDYAKICVEFI